MDHLLYDLLFSLYQTDDVLSAEFICLPLDMYFFQHPLEFVFALRSRKQD